ncbi:hypothetical protein GCM10023205_82310 [Yinghuangia aomiensis]|uniref:Condensation domain-containing protein n=1 Tax=Yinghuangia aomiensis TaxID=676205 RepID=A0ABP9IF77_9ACTN
MLPYDRPRPATDSHQGSDLALWIDARLHAALADLASRAGASLFMVLNAGLAALLTERGAGTDICITSPVAGRTDQALDDLVGCFINVVVLRTDTSADPSFAQLLERVRETALAAYAHQEVPFGHLAKALKPTPRCLTQVRLILQNTPEYDFDLPGMRVREVVAPTGTAKVDFGISLTEREHADGSLAGLDGVIQFRTDLFDERTVGDLATRWVRLLKAAVESPDKPLSELTTSDAPGDTQPDAVRALSVNPQ